MEPRQATRFRLGCTPAQWEGQGLALSVNSPPCLLLKTFSKSSCGYFMLVLAAVIFRVYMLPVSSEAAVSTSHQGVFCSPKNTLCDLACTHPPEDSKHFTNTKLSRQVQCPQPFRAEFLAAALVNFLLLAFGWGSRAEAAKRCQSNMGPSSGSGSEQLNDIKKNKAGDCKANLDWILQQAPGRQTAPTQSSPTSQGCLCCAQSKTKTLALIYKRLSETWGY